MNSSSHMKRGRLAVLAMVIILALLLPTVAYAGNNKIHVVKRGENLSRIARRYDTSVKALKKANRLRNANYIYSGQRLVIPGKSSGSSNGSSSYSGGSGKKWIEIDLSKQRLAARQGNRIVKAFPVSTGTRRYPTPTGTYRIYAKYRAVRMRGPGYDLKGVPWTMFFYGGYAIHGTYWHTNFGTPQSHGCINLSKSNAAWLYRWAPWGTQVKIHR
jgi:lipoprotein-anchoring transpeptidase ErfK/SrfK